MGIIGNFLKDLRNSIPDTPQYEYHSPIYDPKLLCECQYCGNITDKIFKRQRKCENCGEMVYVRHNILGNTDYKKRLYTYQQIQEHEKVLQMEQYKAYLQELELQQEYKKFKQRFGNEAPKQYYLYKIETAKYYKDIYNLGRLYKELGFMYKCDGMMEEAYTFIMLDFLLCVLEGSFFYGGKDEADEILSHFPEGKQKELKNKVPSMFKEIITDLEMGEEMFQIIEFMKFNHQQLQNFNDSKEGVIFLHTLSDYRDNYIQHTIMTELERTYPKHIDIQFGI